MDFSVALGLAETRLVLIHCLSVFFAGSYLCMYAFRCTRLCYIACYTNQVHPSILLCSSIILPAPLNRVSSYILLHTKYIPLHSSTTCLHFIRSHFLLTWGQTFPLNGEKVHFSSGYILRATQLLHALFSVFFSCPLAQSPLVSFFFLPFFFSHPHLSSSPLAPYGATACVTTPLGPFCTAA